MSIQIALHLLSVIPAMFIGVIILLRKKGSATHKRLGRIWVALMLMTAISSFFIKAEGTFSWIHLLSVASICSIGISLWGIRNGKIRLHRGFMVGAYLGAMAAGVYASITPERLIYVFLFGA